MRKPILLPLGKGLRAGILITFSFSWITLAAQPCPTVINCPQGAIIHCDETSNDPFLWNDAPFTVNSTIGGFDQSEATANLNIKMKGCNQGGLGTIFYTLFLDLDHDDIAETVISSTAFPPSGKVLFNNAFNPGFSGGDTVHFDRRVLADSMLYRFALEIEYSGDTTTGWVRFNTAADPYQFSPVQLPEGRHRIEWRTVQDGVERYCDRNFRVKDCKPPTVACKSGLAVYLDASQVVSLSLEDALLSVEDNITPDTQLVLGIRRAGMGTGFPLTAQGIPQDTVMFNCENNENQFIEIWAQDKVGNLGHCSALVLVYDTAGFCPFIPFPTICARPYWDDKEISDVAFRTSWNMPNQPPTITTLEKSFFGCSELIAPPPVGPFTIQAFKDTLPLNGVTTYDLVLISKHILAIDVFDSGWKLTAADANQSNSVTTFDIVELRKLILGLNTKLPNNTPSWRFFVDTCTVWGNPFFGQCPTQYTLPVQAIGAYPPHLSFRGVKMGDVNGTAIIVDTLLGSLETRGAAKVLELPDQILKAGETLEIPLRAADGGEWEGLQFALEYNPEYLDIESVEPLGLLALEAENWAKPQAGVLNFSWSDARATTLLPGDPICYLRLKALSNVQLSDHVNLSQSPKLRAEVYGVSDNHHPLELRFVQDKNKANVGDVQVFAPIPNPTTGAAQLPIRLNSAETVSMEISDLTGKVIWDNQIGLDAGAHYLEIPAAALPQSGVYIWRVFVQELSQSGKLIRI